MNHKPTFLHVFPTFAVGGAQTRFAAVANHLGASARHVIVPIDGRTDAREKLRSGLDVSFIVPPEASRNVRRSVAHARNIIRQVKPDMLITSNWGSIDWAIARLTLAPFGGGVRHLHMEDGFGPEEQDTQLPRRVLTRRLILRSSQVMLPSRTLMKIATDTWRLPASRLHYVPNGIDITRFATAMPAELPPAEGPVIGTIAALRPEKNVMRLLEAVAMLRARPVPVRLVIVGDGPSRPVLQQRAQDLGLQSTVHFAGHSAEPERWMAAFDIFALSSDTEQMPLSVLEAMAAGRPIVATNVGDVGDMLSAENRPYLVPRDSEALSRALAKMLDDPTAVQIGAANGAKAAAAFSETAMFSTFRKMMNLA